MTERGGRIQELESVRGLAALFVVCYHIPPWHALRDIAVVNNSYLMVDLFFVLSGFVIFIAYHDRIASPRDLMRFQFLRFARLYPVHLLFLAVFVLLEAAQYLAESKLGLESPNSEAFRENGPAAFIQQLFLLQALWPAEHATSFNAPAWSVSVEFYLYLLFGLITLLGGRRRDIVFMVLAFVALVMLSGMSFETAYLLRGLAGFFSGCVVANVVGRWQGEPSRIAVPDWASPLAIAVLFLFLLFKTDARLDPLIYLLSAGLVASLALGREGWLTRMLAHKPLVWLGTISYSIYMSHLAVIWGVNQFIRFVLQRPEHVGSNGISVPQLAADEMVLATAVVLIVVVLTSAVVYRTVEAPWRRRSRSLLRDPRFTMNKQYENEDEEYEVTSPPCSMHEVDPAYMGLLGGSERAVTLTDAKSAKVVAPEGRARMSTSGKAP